MQYYYVAQSRSGEREVDCIGNSFVFDFGGVHIGELVIDTTTMHIDECLAIAEAYVASKFSGMRSFNTWLSKVVRFKECGERKGSGYAWSRYDSSYYDEYDIHNVLVGFDEYRKVINDTHDKSTIAAKITELCRRAQQGEDALEMLCNLPPFDLDAVVKAALE